MLEIYKKRSKMSYDDIQEKTNIDRQNVYRTIKEETTPRLDTFGKICLALNMTKEEIGQEVIKYTKKNTQK